MLCPLYLLCVVVVGCCCSCHYYCGFYLFVSRDASVGYSMEALTSSTLDPPLRSWGPQYPRLARVGFGEGRPFKELVALVIALGLGRLCALLAYTLPGRLGGLLAVRRMIVCSFVGLLVGLESRSWLPYCWLHLGLVWSLIQTRSLGEVFFF